MRGERVLTNFFKKWLKLKKIVNEAISPTISPPYLREVLFLSANLLRNLALAVIHYNRTLGLRKLTY